jgi:hypothetical protein
MQERNIVTINSYFQNLNEEITKNKPRNASSTDTRQMFLFLIIRYKIRALKNNLKNSTSNRSIIIIG